jgi:3-oxoadipate enol-lactonase
MNAQAQSPLDPTLDLGHHEAHTLGGPTLAHALDTLSAQAPELSMFTIRHQLGDLAAGATLDPHDWSLMILAALAALGDTANQLGVYADAAIARGATEAEIQDVINIVQAYAGTPRAVNAARAIAQQVPAAVGPARRELIVNLSDHQTGVVTQGEPGTTPILLMHALCMDRHYWRAVAPRLARRGQVIAYDLRAHGRARGGRPPQSLDQMADDAALLMDRLQIEKADVYGASYGGAVAQHFALRHPDRVRALGLLATGARTPHGLLTARAAKAESAGMAAQVAESLHRWFLPESIAMNTWGVRYARSRLLHARVEDWAASWRTMAELDVLDRLSEIKAPTFVLSGVQDLSSYPELMRELADAIPDSRFVSIDPGTHMAVLEQSEAVAIELDRFRARVDSPTPPDTVAIGRKELKEPLQDA